MSNDFPVETKNRYEKMVDFLVTKIWSRIPISHQNGLEAFGGVLLIFAVFGAIGLVALGLIWLLENVLWLAIIVVVAGLYGLCWTIGNTV